MASTIEPHEMTDGRVWEFTHKDVTYRLVSYNGSDKVDLFWLDNGQPVPRGTRKLNGRGSRSVAIEWAEEITGGRSEQTTITVMEAAGKTFEELRAHFRFELVHEEDPTDPRPLVRILRFANLTQAVEFAQLFDPGDHASVWFTYPEDVDTLFDQPVCLSVVFEANTRPAIDHGTDDMRDVIAGIKGMRSR